MSEFEKPTGRRGAKDKAGIKAIPKLDDAKFILFNFPSHISRYLFILSFIFYLC